MTARGKFLLILLLALLIYGYSSWRGGSPLEAETWARLPSDEWPQIVLVNEAEFRGHTDLRGGVGFLIDGGDGSIIGATTSCLLGEDGGVEPEIPRKQLNNALVHWRMQVPESPSQRVALRGLYGRPWAYGGTNVLFLTSDPSPQTPPATPLKLSRGKFDRLQEIYIVVPDPMRVPRQRVYRGVIVSASLDGSLLSMATDPPIEGDVQGAPVLNAKGHLIGIVTGNILRKIMGDGVSSFRRLVD